MLAACAGLPMLLTLTVTGRVALDPPDPLDARIGAAFNDHQRRDGLLGPDAVDRLRGRAIVRPSPWRLGAADAGLIAEWLDGWIAAACEQEPALAVEAAAYRERRLAGPRAGRHRRPRRRAGAAVLKAVLAAGTLAFLVWHLGTGPFLDGLRAVDAGALAAAAGLAVLTTVCCAWRWRVVARGLGDDLPLGTAVASYYRSLFLNVTLPGGVVGDVHRGISHGLRAVVWERSAGQVVQIVLTVAVLLVLPSPLGTTVPLVALALVAGGAVLVWRSELLAGRAWPTITLASALVVAGHAVTFLIAARTAGVTAPLSQMLPLALLVLHGRRAAQRRRLGAARGRDGLGVRRRRPGRVGRRRHRGRLRRDGVRRHAAGRRRPPARAPCLTARTPC